MSEQECKAFVVQAVSHAMARDGSSGGNIRTVIISKEGIKRDFLDGTKVCPSLLNAGFVSHEQLPGPLSLRNESCGTVKVCLVPRDSTDTKVL